MRSCNDGQVMESDIISVPVIQLINRKACLKGIFGYVSIKRDCGKISDKLPDVFLNYFNNTSLMAEKMMKLLVF